LYSSKILKGKYISILEPVPIDSLIQENLSDYREDDELVGSDIEEEMDPEVTAAEIIAKANKEAEAILEKSRLAAEELLQMKKDEADSYKEEVLKKAYDEGYTRGYDECKSAFDKALDGIAEESNKLQESYRELIDGTEAQIIKLLLEVTQKVIDEDVKVNKENVALLVRKALDICYEKQNASIKLSPEDYEYLKKSVPDLMIQINSYENISIKQDANLKDGDCIVDTPFGTIDMGIDKRFDKISDTFMKEVS